MNLPLSEDASRLYEARFMPGWRLDPVAPASEPAFWAECDRSARQHALVFVLRIAFMTDVGALRENRIQPDVGNAVASAQPCPEEPKVKSIRCRSSRPFLHASTSFSLPRQAQSTDHGLEAPFDTYMRHCIRVGMIVPPLVFARCHRMSHAEHGCFGYTRRPGVRAEVVSRPTARSCGGN